jgi:predicted nucleic acid-binding protein
MPDKIFLDTNVLIYYQRSDAPTKQKIATQLLQENECVISTQVLNEICNLLTKKYPTLENDLDRFLWELTECCETISVSPAVIFKALKVHFRYHFSFYDSLMIAAALAAECKVLYSEDMQNGQVIDGSLSIRNPFA